MIRAILYFGSLFALILLFVQCDTTESPPIDDVPPGKREYNWSIDSVDYGNLPSLIQLESIWGSSTTDVWGANGDAPDVRDCLWHYDGMMWSRATEGTPITAGNGNIVVYSVWGTAQNNVWAFGRKINQGTLSSFIMHFNGSQWIDATPANISALSANLYCVYGTAANNIWVGGYEYALHYNGSTWDTYFVADSIIVGSISGNGAQLFISAYSPWGLNIQRIYNLNNGSFILRDETTDLELKFAGLLWANSWKLNSFLNGMVTTNIYKDGTVNKNAWERVFTTNTFFFERAIQTTKNIFAVGQWNLVYHYNGTNWAKITISVPDHTVDPLALFWGVWTNGTEVFICDTENGIVYHGR